MKEKSILILIVLFIISCRQHETEGSLYLRTDFDIEIADEVYTETYPINVNQIQDGKMVALIMQSEQDTVTYELSEIDKNGWYSRMEREKR